MCNRPKLQANLGLATTRELLAELTARIEVDGQLDYRTVDADGPVELTTTNSLSSAESNNCEQDEGA